MQLTRGAGEPRGSHLGEAGVVDAAGPPGLLDSASGRGDARPRFAGVDRHAQACGAGIDAGRAGGFRHAQRVRRRADQDGRMPLHQRADPQCRVEASAGYRQRPDSPGGVEPRPKADKRPEGEGKENAVAGPDARRPVDERPAPDPPVPRFRGIQPAHGPSGRARGLMQPHVLLQGIREVAAKRGVLLLIAYELGFGRQRQAPEIWPIPDVREALDTCRGPLLTVERIALSDPREDGDEPLPLVRREILPRHGFQGGIDKERGIVDAPRPRTGAPGGHGRYSWSSRRRTASRPGAISSSASGVGLNPGSRAASGRPFSRYTRPTIDPSCVITASVAWARLSGR